MLKIFSLINFFKKIMRKWSRFTKIMGKTVRSLSEKKKGKRKVIFTWAIKHLMNGINAH